MLKPQISNFKSSDSDITKINSARLNASLQPTGRAESQIHHSDEINRGAILAHENFNLNEIEMPDVVVEAIDVDGKKMHVVRDDLLPGGTKQRGLAGALTDFVREGKTHFIYVSPFCGYAQLALSYLCKEMGLSCLLYCERDPQSKGMRAHAYTLQAAKWGANIQLVESLSAGARQAAEFASANSEFFEIPLGFDCPEFYRHYRVALEEQWLLILARLPEIPKTVWVSVGSGTLFRSFQKILEGTSTKVCGVNVHV